MIYKQSANFPIIVENVRLDDVDLSRLLRSFNLSFTSILVFSGMNVSCKVAERLIERNSSASKHFEHVTGAENTFAFITRMEKDYDLGNYDLIIGVGGGTVLDTAKLLAAKKVINYVAVPTIISNDGIVSPIAILRDADNRGVSHPAHIPMGVLVDTSLFATSPRSAFLGGIGDIISNLTALLDWDLAVSRRRDKPNNMAKLLAKVAVENIMDVDINPADQSFLDRFIDSIILSGIAMNIAGTSRPCSGAEHLISHVLSKRLLTEEMHGYQVGCITPFVAWLHGLRNEKLWLKMHQWGFDCDFRKLLRDYPLESVIEEAKVIRGERYTILNEHTTEAIVRQYDDYISWGKSLL